MNRKDEWIAIFFAGLGLFNWPIMQVFTGNHYYYLFVLWFVFIALIFFLCLFSKLPNEE